jgi:hypothetical protein
MISLKLAVLQALSLLSWAAAMKNKVPVDLYNFTRIFINPETTYRSYSTGSRLDFRT